MTNDPNQSSIRKKRLSHRTVAKVAAVLLLAVGGLVLAGTMIVRSRERAAMQDRIPDAAAASIAILADGNVVFAPNGTVARALADWMEDHDDEPRSFEVGGDQFLPNQVEPTESAKRRLPGLVVLLAAYPSVKVELIGHTDRLNDEIKSRRISVERARWLRDYLVRYGISSDRLSYSGVGSKDPVARTASSVSSNERIVIRLSPR